jgi:hypothetical protein
LGKSNSRKDPIPVLKRPKRIQAVNLDSIHELNVLAGLKENTMDGSFTVLADAISDMEYQIRSLTESKDKMKFELEYLRRTKLAENYNL